MAMTVLTVCAVALVCAIFSLWFQVGTLGYAYVSENQLRRHNDIKFGRAGNPWQYRVLCFWINGALIRLFSLFMPPGLTGSPRAACWAFITHRAIQNVALFALLALYFDMMGLSVHQSLVGLCVFSMALPASNYDSDLSHNTYAEIILFLMAALAVMAGEPWLVVPIAMIGGFNRETGAPFGLFVLFFWYPIIALAALFAFLIPVVALRKHYGEQRLLKPYGVNLGIDLFRANMRKMTFHVGWATFGAVPLLAIANGFEPFNAPVLFAIAAWVAVHFTCAVASETRLFLVPYAMVIIPSALWPLRS
jgi:hypothetical protein